MAQLQIDHPHPNESIESAPSLVKVRPHRARRRCGRGHSVYCLQERGRRYIKKRGGLARKKEEEQGGKLLLASHTEDERKNCERGGSTGQSRAPFQPCTPGVRLPEARVSALGRPREFPPTPTTPT